MCQLNEKSWILYALTGSSFFRFPLNYFGYELPSGAILVAENDFHAREVCSNLIRLFGGAQILKWNRRSERPENFRMGIHRYRKNDTEEELDNFLSEKDFLPVVVVGGVVPEKLCGKGYIFKASFDTEEIKRVANEYLRLQDFLISKIGYICQEIRVLDKSNMLKKYREKGMSSFAHYMLAVAKVWWCFKCEEFTEETADQWISAFIREVIKAEAEMARFTELYSVREAVKACTIKSVMEGELNVKNVHDGMNTESSSIYHDEDFYFIAESLLKKICAPLLDTVSFLQLKKEMEADGILIANEISGSYTVKKLIYSTETGQTKRIRMLKLNKEDFVNSEGICLEDLQEFYKEREEN